MIEYNERGIVDKIIVNAYSGFSYLASLCFEKSYLNFDNEPASFHASSI